MSLSTVGRQERIAMSSQEEYFPLFPKCSVARRGQTMVVSLEGEIDYATAAMADVELCAVMPSGGDVRVVVDLSGVAYLGAAGLHVLADVNRQLRQRGGQLEVVCPNPCQRRLFAITELDQALIVHADFPAGA